MMVSGIGGIFFKTNDVQATKDWYAKHLGFDTDAYGAVFKFFQASDPSKSGYLQWSPMPTDTEYFGEESQQYMINYRVENLELLVAELKKKGVHFCDEIETFEYGKFVHLLDGDGRKIELWEPIDVVFDDFYADKK